MAYLNRVFLIGNLTRDPEIRVTPKGTSTASFGLAVNRTYRDEAGASHEEVTFIDIEAWGKQAELVGKYLAKGSPCMVEGRLKLDQWEDKTSGQKRSKLKVVLDNVQFLGCKSDGTPAEMREGEPPPQQRAQTPLAQRTAATPGPVAEDDVPF